MDEMSISDPERIINHWVEGSDDDHSTMMAMFEAGRYGWALFMGHLMMEKLLKALYVKVNNGHPPYTHNLLRLADLSGLEIDDETRTFLSTVTAFNINARYDDYKRTFQRTCTRTFTEQWIRTLQHKRLWMRTLLGL